MNKQFEEGIELGVLASWFWYLLWWGLALYVAAKTHNWAYVFGTLSCGIIVSLGLDKIVKLFLLKD